MRSAALRISALLIIGLLGTSLSCHAVGQEIPKKALKLIAQAAKEQGVSVKELRRNPELRRKIFEKLRKNPKLRAEIGRIIEEGGSPTRPITWPRARRSEGQLWRGSSPKR